MKNLILLIAAFTLLLSTNIFAQYDRNDFENNKFHKNITLEIGGSHIIWGLNYDMRIKRGRNDGFGFKVGVGGAQFRVSNDDSSIGAGYVTVPIEFNHILGKRRHGLVTGLGIIAGHASLRGEIPNESFDLSGTGVFAAYANVGYRFQPLESGFTFQINLNPLLTLNGQALPYAGISLGYGFK